MILIRLNWVTVIAFRGQEVMQVQSIMLGHNEQRINISGNIVGIPEKHLYTHNLDRANCNM